MPPARPYWKGYLKLALVSCPIAVYTGTSSTERVSFRQINKKTGNRLRQQLVDEVTREPVEPQDKGRGYEYSKNTYILVDDDELDAIAIESNQIIEIDSFVPRDQIDERYLDSPYYITPDDQVGQDAFAVVREAMRGKGMVALARIVLAKRERVMMIQPWDKGLMGTTLRYPYEIRDTKEYFEDIPNVKVAPDMLKLAEHILKTKEGDFEPSEFVDHYETAVVEMLKEKQAGVRGFGMASKNVKFQMPHLIWQFPELRDIHTATINVQLEKPLRITKYERTTLPLPWWDADVNNSDSGRWHVEQFSILPIKFEFPVKAPTKEAWLFVAHDSATFRSAYHYEIVTVKIDKLMPGAVCKIHIVKTDGISVG
jgi:DNA end-binding protein Ku